MRGMRHVGRATVRRHVGRIRPPAVGSASVANNAPTGIIRPGKEPPPPVFVDATGQRKRRLGIVAAAIAILALVLVALVWLSQAADDVRPQPAVRCATASADAPHAASPTPSAAPRRDDTCTALPAIPIRTQLAEATVGRVS